MSWIEFAVVMVLLALIGGVLLQRLLYYRAAAERAGFAYNLANLRSALRIESALLLNRGRAADIAALAGANPIRWLDAPPAGYLGEFDQAPVDTPGSWYFDRGRRELVYRVAALAYLSEPATGELRLQVVGSPAIGATLPSARIELVTAYRWNLD